MFTLGFLPLTLLVGTLLSGQQVQAQSANSARPLQYLFVFGDSYSTIGFNVSQDPQPTVGNPLGNPAYPGARLSGGDIWLDVVIDNYTRRAVAYDFAVGGNTVNSSRVQAGPFSAGPPIYDFTDQHAEFESVSNQIRWNRYNSIFISWFGINDVAVQVYRGRSFDEAQSLLLPDIGDYFRLLPRQYRIGARKFITVLVPPINRAPVFGYGTAANAPDVDQVLQYWNQNMKQEHDKFRRRHPFADARIVDPTDLFNRILNDPETYGAPNSSCFNFPEGQPCLWHDFIHPGIVIQAELGNLIGRVVRSMNRFLG